MRDRLIELIYCAGRDYDDYVDSQHEMGMRAHEDFDEWLADELLAKGYILPPCKVGDKVYKISRNKVKECEVVFIGISADEKCSYFNFVENYADGTFYKSYSMVFDVIGKTVFLTKEEAERALKERESNG